MVNNAGIGGPEDYVTEDGINLIMQVNYYGHFLLTLLLLPLLKKTGAPSDPARIINNSSRLHYLFSQEYITLNVGGRSLAAKYVIYGTSKLCLALFTRELTKKVDANVVVNTADPGTVGTNIFYSINFLVCFVVSKLFYTFSKTPLEGAQTAIHVAIQIKGQDVKGEYFRNRLVNIPSAKATNDELSSKVWKDSIRLVKLTALELDMCLNNV